MGVIMAVKMQTFDSREEWLKAMGARIGGSEADCLLGREKQCLN
jgi:hypothetical protein